MNSWELTSAITAVANSVACRLSVNEISLLASILVQLGDTLATIATQRSIYEELSENNNNR